MKFGEPFCEASRKFRWISNRKLANLHNRCRQALHPYKDTLQLGGEGKYMANDDCKQLKMSLFLDYRLITAKKASLNAEKCVCSSSLEDFNAYLCVPIATSI